MKLKDQIGWDNGIQNNQDAYGAAVYKYAERWANLMETEIDKGAAVQDVAGQTSREADVDGITVFMYGCAVSILSQAWEYGEDLRKWHNGEHKYTDDGVVNPAILTVG